MSQIVEPKTYTGKDLETIFFRPMLTGPDARDLGIKIMYNMPVPTTLNFWKAAYNVLQKYTTGGWKGGNAPEKFQKTIELHKVKAEMGYSASDYFTMVYELITNRPEVNLDDLSGTELEEAETKLFKDAIAESLRVTMWLGKKSRQADFFNTFDGFLHRIITDCAESDISYSTIDQSVYSAVDGGETILKNVWEQSLPYLRDIKNEGQLVYFVTSDIYSKYEESLDSSTLEAAYIAKQEGRESLSYRGIPVVDIQVSSYLPLLEDMPQSFAILTDRRNLALAVNTADFPGTEIRMWYNPDEMENRQRAVFMAGCDYLLPEMVSIAVKA